MALDTSQTKAIPFLSQGLLEVPKSSKNTSQMQHVQRNRKELNLSLRKTPFGIENIITSEGHRLNLYDTNSFGAVV
jgi:hypothetical protein